MISRQWARVTMECVCGKSTEEVAVAEGLKPARVGYIRINVLRSIGIWGNRPLSQGMADPQRVMLRLRDYVPRAQVHADSPEGFYYAELNRPGRG